MFTRYGSKGKQKGAVLALFVISMVVLIAMAGLALDVSHAYVDKTRLQNAVDAAALSGALTLMNTHNETTAETDALATFNADLEAEFGSSLTPEVRFSDSLSSWSGHAAAGPDPDSRFVQVSLLDRGGTDNTFQMTAWLTRILGWNTLPVGVSATAGPIRAAPCRLEPLIACGDPDAPCTDPESTCYGFDRTQYTGGSGENPPEECYLKGCPGSSSCNDSSDLDGGCGVQSGGPVGTAGGDIGPGNFYTAKLDCSGANCLRDAFKDTSTYSCADLGGKVITEPGNMVGPMTQAYNTKFGDFNGPVNSTEWPPDTITTETYAGGTLFYDDYSNPALQGALGHSTNNNAVDDKRVMNIIIADCSGKNNGRADLDVLTIGCFFGTKKITGGGSDIVVFGQFVSGKACGGDSITLDPTLDTFKIVLYKDPDTDDS